jgi:8-oxo-dGTP pyrophosphatase MutT (NUDIX family)
MTLEPASLPYIQRLRNELGHRKIILVFASAIITNEKGQVLWQKRSDFKIWGLPGGMLEPDESLETCIAREVQEETGLEIAPGRIIGLYTSPDYDFQYPNQDSVQQFTVCFECKHIGGDLVADQEESLELAWFDTGKPPITLPWYQDMIDDYSLKQPRPIFIHRSAGKASSGEPYFQTLRDKLGHQQLILAGCAAAVFDEPGRILLQKRADDKTWGLPGGIMELGERIDQTVIREVKEETGLTVKPVELVHVFSDENFNVTYPNGDQTKSVVALFRCEIESGKLIIDPEETSELKFLRNNEFPKEITRNMAILIKELF